MKPTIAITMGDPCGIGPEVIVKGLLDKTLYDVCRPFVIGSFQEIKKAASLFAPQLKIKSIKSIKDAEYKIGVLEILDVGEGERQNDIQYGKAHPAGAALALASIRKAAQLALDRDIDAIATAPIHKAAMKGVGFSFPGHTEFFAETAKEANFGMMMFGAGLKIMLNSIHLPLREAIVQLNKDAILKKIKLTAASIKQDFGIKNPRIAVAGLNPHAGEEGLFGEEETREVLPAVLSAREEGIEASGPHPADTLFYQLRCGLFDAALALYHDQALIPIKLLAFGKGVNITVGLPFIRTSVDHGTAFDIAGKGIADAGSMKEAIMLAAKMAGHRYSP